MAMITCSRIERDEGGNPGSVDALDLVQIENHILVAQQRREALYKALFFAANQFGHLGWRYDERVIGLTECGVHLKPPMCEVRSRDHVMSITGPQTFSRVVSCTRAANSSISESTEIIAYTGSPVIGFTNAGVRFSVRAFAYEHAAK
jgi:hypothetical protein